MWYLTSCMWDILPKVLIVNCSQPMNMSFLVTSSPFLASVCLISVSLAASRASQCALTCSFIHRSPPALWPNRPPFLLHLFLYHFLAFLLSVLSLPAGSFSLAVHLLQSVSLSPLRGFLGLCLPHGEGSCLALLFPAASSPPSARRNRNEKTCQQGSWVERKQPEVTREVGIKKLDFYWADCFHFYRRDGFV